MDARLLRKAKALFIDAAALPEDARGSFLDERCGTDDDLRRQVESLLRWDRGPTSEFLQGPGIDLRVTPAVGADDDAGVGMIGRRIEGFTIERFLASGGMGSVYVAAQDRPRRSVALKLMRTGVTSRSALRRFELESHALGRLHHPNIAQVYEAGTYDDGSGGAPYFAMEYVPDARSITAHAKAESLGLRDRLMLFTKVCNAVHHGHENGIIHRDLKPSNILVNVSGEPKVIDFGVAKSTDSDLAVTTLRTDVGELVGTLQYMSPEQCAGERSDLDARSDAYALGVVLYELLCGGLPYDVSGVPLPVAARVIQEEEPTRPSTVNRTLRGDVETIALKALEKERARRYQSAADLEQDIGRYLRGEAIEARPPTALYRARTFARRHRAASAVAAILLVAGPLLIVATTVAVRSAARARALDDLLATGPTTVDPRTAVPKAAGRSWSGFERRVDAAVAAFMRNHGVPGATVAIAKHGRLVHSKGYGLADAQRRIEMQPWHRTRIDVVGNALVVTPALLTMLESASDIDLDTPLYGPGGVFEGEPFLADIEIGIADLPPEERERQRAWYRKLTLRHLVNGTSGFKGASMSTEDALERRYGEIEPGVTFRDLHRGVLRTDRLRHEPGRDDPRGHGHPRALTGYALTVLSGMPYVTYVEEHLLEPLGLRGRVVPEGTVVDERDALPHEEVNGRLFTNEITRISRPRPYSAHGGWVASARDLVRLMVSMDGLDTPPDILSETELEELRGLASARARTATFRTKTDARGYRKHVRHGAQVGGSASVAMFPEGYVSDSGTDLSHITIAVCVNIRIRPAGTIGTELSDGLVTLVGEASIPDTFDIWNAAGTPSAGR